MSKDFKVLWTENAIEDLLAIKEYISEDSATELKLGFLNFLIQVKAL